MAIIILTIIIRLILCPLSIKALHSQKILQKLQPQLQEIQKKYKDDFNPFYAYIMKYNIDYLETGSGVNLKSENLIAQLQDDVDINTKYIYKQYSDPQNPDPAEDGNPDTIIKDKGTIYTEGTTEGECCTEENLDPSSSSFNPDCTDEDVFINDINGTCLKDIIINGSYYVILYSRNDKSGEKLCQDFTTDWSNIISTTNLLDDRRYLYKMAIIPKY